MFKTSNRSSTPIMRPNPRTSLTILCLAWSSSSFSLKYPPSVAALSGSLSTTITSIAAHAAAQTSGFPLKVLVCSPSLREDITFSFAIVMPSGRPPATDFARHIISGVTPQCSHANIFPVRPNPVWTSSNIKRRLSSSQIFLSP